MTIHKALQDGKLTIAVEGWLDANSAPQLGAEIHTIGNVTAIVLDFDKLEYISSAGLRQVAAIADKAESLNASFSVINVGDDAMSVFKMTGLTQVFDIRAKQR